MTTNTPEIRLFVSCHKAFSVPRNTLLHPLHVGAALSADFFQEFLRDDSGENISALNRRYCELTGQYWVWKNVEADYCGFFHYRRYLYPDTAARRPYIIRTAPTEKELERLGFQDFPQLIGQYDLIAPMGEDMHVSVREHYASAPFHHVKDLALTEQIIRELYPAYVPAMERYLSGSVCYFGNIFIMSRPVFDDYCRWLFDVLAEFDRRADVTGYGPQELRVDGYLAERLFGIYYTHRRDELRTLELPRVHFDCFGGTAAERRRTRLLYHLLPPGSKRRAWVKHAGRQGRMMEREIAVSVIMLAYNQEAYIAQAIESVLAQQTGFRYELLIGDDASPDGTGEIAEDYARRYPDRIRVFRRPENLGASRNAYELLCQAQGRYLAFCEGDDYWTAPDKLAVQYAFLEEHPDLIGCHPPLRGGG